MTLYQYRSISFGTKISNQMNHELSKISNIYDLKNLVHTSNRVKHYTVVQYFAYIGLFLHNLHISLYKKSTYIHIYMKSTYIYIYIRNLKFYFSSL